MSLQAGYIPSYPGPDPETRGSTELAELYKSADVGPEPGQQGEFKDKGILCTFL